MEDTIKKVYMYAGSVKYMMFEGYEYDCIEFCEMYNWEITDENGFCWDLKIED